MKKRFILMLMILTIITVAGCRKQAFSDILLVEDEIPAMNTLESARYTIFFAQPEGVRQMSASRDGKTLYEAADGSYTIVTQIVPGEKADAVIREMTGFEKQELLVLQTERFSMPEYRFTWTAGGEGGLLICHGAVLEDENCCYTIQFATAEEVGTQCAHDRESVLSTFSLTGQEGF